MEHYLIPFERIPLISLYVLSLSFLRGSSSIGPTTSHDRTFRNITIDSTVRARRNG